MKYRNRSLRLLAALVMLLTGGLFTPTGGSALALDQSVVDRVVPAVVQLGPVVVQTTNGAQKVLPFGWGSGTIVAPNGYILTNHHVTDLTDAVEHFKDKAGVRVMDGVLAVFLTTQADAPPVPSYLAEVVADSPQLNLAVLHITQDLSGAPVDASRLNLPALPIGDSDKVKLGQSLSVFGYAGQGGDSISYTPGDVTGFNSEAGVTGRAWIKVSASLPGGNSGGTVVNDQGELVAIPTGSSSNSAECQAVTDTSGDGKIDAKDLCVPVGGSINALRPANLAKDLVAEATGSVRQNRPDPSQGSPTAEPTTETTPVAPAATGTVVAGTPMPEAQGDCEGTPASDDAPARSYTGCVLRSFFADGVVEDDSGVGSPAHVVTSVPSGTRALVMFFDYSKFEDGAEFLPHIYKDGQEIEDAFQAGSWDASKFGSAGVYWFGYTDAELEDATYRYDLEYDNYILASGTITIGGAASSDPKISNITFSGGGKTGSLLPAGIDEVEADFDTENMGGGPQVQAIWSSRGEAGDWTALKQSTPGKWTGPDAGKGASTYTPDSPLAAGNYRFEVLVNGKLTATRDFSLAGTAEEDQTPVTDTTPEVEATPTAAPDNTTPDVPPASPTTTPAPAPVNSFGPITLASGIDDQDQPVDVGTSFADIYELYAFFDYQGMKNGMKWSDVWYRDGKVIASGDSTWSSGAEGNHFIYITMDDGGTLPSGTYEVRLYLNGRELQRASADITEQQSPNPPPPTPGPQGSFAYVSGQVTDGYTGRPIYGALVAILRPGVTWSNYSGNQSDILEYAYTDVTGRFSLPSPLQKGRSYSIAVEAQGYNPIYQDDVQVNANASDEIEVSIEMQSLR